MDWRCNAARAASSSRTSWGTPLMVICTGMNALCHRRQRPASSLPSLPNRGSGVMLPQRVNKLLFGEFRSFHCPLLPIREDL